MILIKNRGDNKITLVIIQILLGGSHHDIKFFIVYLSITVDINIVN